VQVLVCAQGGEHRIRDFTQFTDLDLVPQVVQGHPKWKAICPTQVDQGGLVIVAADSQNSQPALCTRSVIPASQNEVRPEITSQKRVLVPLRHF